MNQSTPYGTTTYQQTGTTTVDGNTVPEYSQTVQLSPAEQQLLNTQTGTANTLGSTAEGIAKGYQYNPLDLSALPNTSNPQMFDTNAVNAAYGLSTSFLDPQFQQSQTNLQDQLTQQGIPVGSAAYENAMTQFDNSKNQAYNAAADNAIQSGAANAANLYGMDVQGANLGLQEQEAAQQQPINLISALLSGSPTVPSQPVTTPSAQGVSPTNVLAAYQQQQNAQDLAYQGAMATANSNNSSLGSLLGAGAMAAMMFL